MVKKKFKPSDFKVNNNLYRGFDNDDLLPNTDDIDVNTIRFPDVSCNWDRFSDPEDIRKIEGRRPSTATPFFVPPKPPTCSFQA
ncbi:MAG: hypothetical protein ACUZ8E_18445 [Candidatus Anammoxibacter sp.]